MLATAAPTFTTPPVVTLPASAGSGVTVSSTASMTWLIDQVGWAASTRATVPVTRGAAIDVPLIVPYEPFESMLYTLTPGAASWTEPVP